MSSCQLEQPVVDLYRPIQLYDRMGKSYIGCHPRRWRAWAHRRGRERAIGRANKFVQGVLVQRRPEENQDKDYKVSDPDPFKGDPKDLERFLLQITKKFVMEP